jgi:putative hemolysin
MPLHDGRMDGDPTAVAERIDSLRPADARVPARRPAGLERVLRSTAVARPLPPWTAEWARSPHQVRDAQRLRYQVFAEELGARLCPPPGTPEGLDADEFDPHCEHLIIRTTAAAPGPAGQVVGTYRVLTPEAARRAGALYTEREFDLAPLAGQRRHLAELGRSCVHPAWRQGGVMLGLWAALAEFLTRQGLPAVIGCASVGLGDGGHRAASVWRSLQPHLEEPASRVRPLRPLPVEDLRGDLDVDPPPLVKGYLRCGARVLGPPAWDPDFNVADFPMLLRLADMPRRYRRHLIGGP